MSINGGGGLRGGNEWLVDGIPNTVQGGGIAWVPTLDTVEEVKVDTTMFDASLGHSTGGAINITTKAGTNDLHGTGYLFKQSDVLDANGWTNNKNGIPRPYVGYQQWGYVFSGPVVVPKFYTGRNKTFFLTSLQRDSDPRPLFATSRVPTQQERQGDFSQTLNQKGGPLQIYDPATTIVNGATATRQIFPGAQIPASRLSPVGIAVLNAQPLPNQQGIAPQVGGLSNWAISKVYYVSQRQYSGRIDRYLSDNQRLFGRFSYLTRTNDSDGVPDGMLAPNQGHGITRFLNFALDDTIVFSPSFVGSFRGGALRTDSKTRTGGASLDTKSLSLPGSLLSNQVSKGYPNFVLGENTIVIGSTQAFTGRDEYSLLATFTKLSGRQSLKFGVDYRLNRWSIDSPGNSAFGTFNFSSVFTQADPFTNTSAQTSGTAMASLLLGLPASGSLGYVSPLSLQYHYLGAFLQDDWKITPKLTLNVGLRWELDTPLTERYNRMTYGFDANITPSVQVPGLKTTGGLTFAGVGGKPRSGGPVDLNNFGPRFGFAYNFLPKTVVRGGYGMFFANEANLNSFHGQQGAFDTETPFTGTINGGATPFNTLANPFPAGLQQPLGSALGAAAGIGNSISFFDDRRVTPYTQQWQFSIQRELRSRIVVEAAYVGMHSLKLPEAFDLNELPDPYLAQGAAQNTPVPNPFVGILPATSTLGQGATIRQKQLWLRYPQYTSVLIQGAPTGAAGYNALQLKGEKRLTHGINLLGTYTFSKLLTNNTTSLVNIRDYHAVSALDQTHNFRAAFSYDLPFHFDHYNRVVRGALGGWQLSGIYTWKSGFPLTITDSNGRPLRLRNPRLSGPVDTRLGDHRDPKTGTVLNPYFDVGAFQSLPSQYVISPEPPYLAELRAPGEKSTSAYLYKDFRVVERLKVQLSIQADDVFNGTFFNPPGTNKANAGTFGIIQGGDGPELTGRSIQLGVRIRF